ncbi:hypothetical protein ACWDT6_30435 [Nocardia grenadensis]|uniref:hypothetical protein n=1 Tax=Embleya sp. NPDC005971 TaxID=3156724 RepID=UPI0033FEEDEE
MIAPAASLRSLLGRVVPAGRGPRTPARVEHDAHVVTRIPPRPHRAPGQRLADEDWYVAPGSLFEPVPTGRHRRAK